MIKIEINSDKDGHDDGCCNVAMMMLLLMRRVLPMIINGTSDCEHIVSRKRILHHVTPQRHHKN